ncbi:hypothetical protein E4L95_06435 [Paracoccus liaowanqingii]|uniref:Uncharacterized protein n=1 Tax=Paracoccus liaowanqingii TaxID=2560053 RepID=A0A4Z1CAX4_9RHOB|nr:hypothetical protein [Paracoccus liaowanqingii]TGN62505.1 hypothetical protein E4L95_06435 [Paracoccus liaowanqingii]
MIGVAALASCSPQTASAPRQTIPAQVPDVPAGTELSTAKTSYEAGSFGYAARYFQMALTSSPNDMQACLGLAGSYDWLYRFDLADRTYATCRQIGGETFAYHNNVGFSYFLRGENGRASVSLAQARALRPGHPVIETNLRILRDASSG